MSNDEMPFVPPPPPSMTQQWSRYAEMARRDPVRRRNAGSVNSNLPLIITGGSARHAEFHYQFTEPGKFQKKKKGTFSLDVVATRGVREVAEKLKYRAPQTYCPDCDRNDIPPHKVAWLGMWAVTEPHADIDLRPGETLIHTKCSDCVADEVTGRVDIALPGNGGEDLDESRLMNIRQNRMERNLCAFIRNRLLANDSSVVISQEERARLGMALDGSW